MVMAWMLVVGLLGLALSGIWDGIYTSGQAERGRAAYEANCLACHGAELTGRSAQALVGEPFWRAWGEDSLASLDTIVRRTMPRTAPGTLDAATYTDILTYILERNGFPSGRGQLTPAHVPGIRIVGRDGPMPVPNFSLVRVVGCLREQPAGAWMLERATEPIRTRTPVPSEGVDRDDAATRPLGAGAFGLMNAERATVGHGGEKVEVKGLLIRGPLNRINFSTLQSLAPTCE